jgi:hypothetical protein
MYTVSTLIIIIIQFKANYKVSTTKEEKQNTHKLYKKAIYTDLTAHPSP